MKKVLFISAMIINSVSFAQKENKKDTTRFNLGEMYEVILVPRDKTKSDTVDASPTKDEKEKNEAHWAGLDFGFTTLLNSNYNSSFKDNPFWENDLGKSMTWNWNLFEHKFGKTIGFTTGLGLSFTRTAFKDNYTLVYSSDTLFATIDTTRAYTENKLRAAYLTLPLLLDISSAKKGANGFYLAAGFVPGVRISSRIKRTGQFDGQEFSEKIKGTYGLNAFRLDATMRIGFDDWGFGAFASYNLIPLFDTNKTVEVFPFTVGLSLNF